MTETLASHFNRVANDYEKAASVPRLSARILAERIKFMRLPAGVVVDLGSGTGWGARLLQKQHRFPHIIQMDISRRMLEQSKKKEGRWFSRQDFVCADAMSAPLAEQKASLVYSNLMLHWCEDLPALFRQVRTLLRPGGAFVFSACGPDTLCEFQRAFADMGERSRVNAFPSMAQLASLSVEAGFVDSVLDVDRHFLRAPGIKELMRCLQQAGSTYVKAGHRPLSREQLRQIKQAYEQERQSDGLLPATFEVIYGHGFCPETEKHSMTDDKKPVTWWPRQEA